MLTQAKDEAPHECLGFLFGHNQQVNRQVALRNIAATPTTSYFADPGQVLKALQEADSNGEEHLGIYHSHPKGPQTPSATDLAEARYDVVQLIIVPETGILRGFQLSQDSYQEIDLVVLKST